MEEIKKIRLNGDKSYNLTAQQLVSKLLAKSELLRRYLNFTMYQYKFDWNRTFKNNPEAFKFTNIDFVKQHSDGCPWFHIIFCKNSLAIITRNEVTEEFYDNHIIFENNDLSLKKYLNTCNPLLVISCNFQNFLTIQTKQYHYSSDYVLYKCECNKKKRFEKAIELKILKHVLELAEKMPNHMDLRYESVFTKYLTDAIRQTIDNPKINKYLLPVTKFKLRNTDFEIDYSKHRAYIEYRLEYTYKLHNEEITYPYGNILPTYIHYRNLLYMRGLSGVVIATYLDCLLQIFHGFNNIIPVQDIRLIISNLVNNGFSKENQNKFSKFFR